MDISEGIENVIVPRGYPNSRSLLTPQTRRNEININGVTKLISLRTQTDLFLIKYWTFVFSLFIQTLSIETKIFTSFYQSKLKRSWTNFYSTCVYILNKMLLKDPLQLRCSNKESHNLAFIFIDENQYHTEFH